MTDFIIIGRTILLKQWFSTPVLGTHCSAHFVCLSYLTHSVYRVYPIELRIWIRCVK